MLSNFYLIKRILDNFSQNGSVGGKEERIAGFK